MKLIGTLQSPYVRKARTALIEKHISFDFVLTELGASDDIAPKFNPLAKVPSLVLDNGQTIYDSSVIVDYADTLTSIEKLIPDNGMERAQVKCWEALADGIMDAAVLVRLEARRPTEQQSDSWVSLQMQKVHSGLKMMSTQLGDREFCHGNSLTLADIAVECALGWLLVKFPDIEWQKDYPNLNRFYQAMASRPSFQATRP